MMAVLYIGGRARIAIPIRYGGDNFIQKKDA